MMSNFGTIEDCYWAIGIIAGDPIKIFNVKERFFCKSVLVYSLHPEYQVCRAHCVN